MATLLSLNVGMPKDVSWRGRTVHTGVWKSPVDGRGWCGASTSTATGKATSQGTAGSSARCSSTRSSPTGTGRVFSVATTSSAALRGELHRRRSRDDEVCIGDRMRIGEAEFEVTQPRVTCFRVGMRMGEPRLPSLLVAHHRPGFYLRVLTEGHVSAGDEIVRTAAGPESSDRRRGRRAALPARARPGRWGPPWTSLP